MIPIKQRKETPIENTFNVDVLISIHHGLMLKDHNPSPIYKNNGVMYDFWQLFYMEDGSYHVQMEDCPLQAMKKGQLLICEPGKIRFSLEHTNAVVGIINIRCNSPKMKPLKNRVFTLTEEEQLTINRILETGSQTFQLLPQEAPYTGQQPLEGTTDYQLQIFKNHIELLLIAFYQRCEKEVEYSSILQNQQNYYEAKFHMIESYMKGNLRQMLTVEEICSYTGFSENTVKRIFHQQTDCGAIHYFLRLKIKEAKRLLLETDMNVTQISEYLGFSSIHYFSKTFKRFAGMSPRQYVHATQISNV